MPEELTGMAKVETWVLCLVDYNNGEPLFYYNPVDDKFQREFINKCAYWSEIECADKEKELNLEGLQIVKGIMDVPKQYLVDSLMKVFVEHGLAKSE